MVFLILTSFTLLEILASRHNVPLKTYLFCGLTSKCLLLFLVLVIYIEKKLPG